MLKFKYLYLPHRSSFNESFKEKRCLRDIDNVYAHLLTLYPGISDINDIVFRNEYFYDSRLDLVGCWVCVNKYYNEDYLKQYGCAQCIGYLYDYSGDIFPKVNKHYVKN